MNLDFMSFQNVFEPNLIKELEECPVSEIDSESEILSEGAYIKAVPLIISGNIKVVRFDQTGKEILVYNINPGESCILSITSSITQNKSKVIAITENKTKAIIISSEKIKLWMEKYSSWRNYVMDLYYNRLNELISAFEDLAFKNIDQRLIVRLNHKDKDPEGWVHTTHQELADELGTAREVVSRLLKQLEKQGKIKISRGKINILGEL